jgi:hypothetical protein
MVIWYDILFNVNTVSKKLQSPSMCIDSTLRNIEGTMFFLNYRNKVFAYSLNIVIEIAKEIGVGPSFPVKCSASRKRHFDETDCKEAKVEAKRAFEVNYFLVMVDIAISSLKSRFEDLQSFKAIFVFFMSGANLKSLVIIELIDFCTKFTNTLSLSGSSDVDLNDLIS